MEEQAQNPEQKTSSSEPSAEWKAHVLPHSELRTLYENRLWIVEGTLKNGIRRNMVIYKMNNGNLWLHSVVALNEETMAKVLALGTLEYFVVPNAQHTMDIGVYKARFPDAKVVCGPAFKEVVSKKATVDLEPDKLDSATTGVTCLTGKGVKSSGANGIGGEKTFKLDLGNNKSALVFCDLMFNVVNNSGLRKFMLGNTFMFPRIIRWFVLSNTNEFKNWLIEQATDDLAVICVAHGVPVTENAAQALKDAANRSV
jgi:hypothetical protein